MRADGTNLNLNAFIYNNQEGWYLQPEAQISTSYQDALHFKSASNDLNVDVDSYNSTLVQEGVRLGHGISSAIMFM